MYVLCSHVSIVSCSICVFFLSSYFYYAIFINNNLCSDSCVFYVYINLNDHTKHFIYIFYMYQPLLIFLIGTLLLNCDTDSLFLSLSIIHKRSENILHSITA